MKKPTTISKESVSEYREFVQLRLRKRVLEAIEVVLEEEVNQALGCGSYERVEDRRGYRNGAETVMVYLYNFSVLPSNFTFATFYLQNLFSFLNLGLAGFVLSAVAVRFVFTAVSIEGRAFWIIRSSPLSLKKFLWSKFWTALPPLLVLSQILTIVSNHFLGASRFMTVLASVSIFFV